MRKSIFNIRLMKAGDLDAVVKIDEKVLGTARPEYYAMKFEKIFQTADYLPTSLVAATRDGAVVGFVMGELYIGEYGISQDGATLDTIGVDPDYQGEGIGEQLVTEFVAHLRALDVKKVSTLVDSGAAGMMRFFRANQFGPSATIHLERDI